jgi:uncharacterized damage-inducible protein DinB
MSDEIVARVLNQIEVCVKTLIEMLDSINEPDLLNRPTVNKMSIGELCEHIAVICEGDWRISNQATKEAMVDFYSQVSLKNLPQIKDNMVKNFEALKKHYLLLPIETLHEKTTSYWGLTYTRYEWLLEILAHLYHHRGQLHAILVHCYQKDPGVLLFE